MQFDARGLGGGGGGGAAIHAPAQASFRDQ